MFFEPVFFIYQCGFRKSHSVQQRPSTSMAERWMGCVDSTGACVVLLKDLPKVF